MWGRGWLKLYYSPIYTVFLLESLNEDLTIYFGQDIVGEGLSATEADLANLKRRLNVNAFASMLLSALILPAWAGVVGVLLLPEPALPAYILAYVAYRAWRCRVSFRDFGTHAIATSAARRTLTLVYASYVVVAAYVIRQAATWAAPQVAAGDYVGLVTSAADILVGQGLIAACLVAAISTVFSNTVADPSVRSDQLRALQEHHDRLKRISFAPPFGPPVAPRTGGTAQEPPVGLGRSAGGDISSAT